MFGGLIRFIRRVAEKVKFSIFIPTNLFQGKEKNRFKKYCIMYKEQNNEEVEKTHSSNQVIFDNI